MSAADLLPPNATVFEKAQSATDGVRILASPTDLIRLDRQPETCSESFIAPLAWERSVHHWVVGDDAGNRARIASSFVDHGAYGSPAALEEEISLDVGYPCLVREYDEFAGGVWPDFKVDATVQPGQPMPNLAAVNTSALMRKNVRDLYAGSRIFAVQPPAAMNVGSGTFASVVAMVLPLASAIQPAMTVGAASRVIVNAKVRPLRTS